MAVLSRFAVFTRRYPIVRGMISYATIWPTSCLIQQTIAGKRWENYEWMQMLRFSLYGSSVVAPMLYGWVRITTIVWPQKTLRSAVTKALVEQVTYGPMALVLFFFLMSLLENKTVEQAKDEVKAKFWPTYKGDSDELKTSSPFPATKKTHVQLGNIKEETQQD